MPTGLAVGSGLKEKVKQTRILSSANGKMELRLTEIGKVVEKV